MIRKLRVIPRWLQAVLLLALACFLAGGMWFYHQQTQVLRRRAQQNLTNIAESGANEIAVWRAERLHEASVLMASPFIVQEVFYWFERPGKTGKARILARFRPLEDYQDIYLVDTNGQVRLSESGRPVVLPPSIQQSVASALQSHQPVLTPLILSNPRTPPCVAVIAPLETSNAPVGAIVLLTDARRMLAATESAWRSGGSVKTVLIERENDSVMLLDETATKMTRVPLTATNRVVVKAALGRRNDLEGLDAAGVPMLAGVEAVAGTPWLLMARTNVTDVFASWRSRARVLLVLVLALLITVGSIVFAAWQRSLQEHYRERLKMEAELRQTQERFQLLAESSAVGIYLIQDGRFEYVNPAFAAIFGYEIAEIAGRLAVAEIVHPEHRVRVAYNLQHHLVEKNGPKHYEFRGKRKDGTEILLEAHDRYLEYGGRPGVIGSLADITQRKQLEAELQRSQRMESLGALASGIAHDLNNALTPVIIGAELLRPGQDQRGLQLLDTISSSARRGTEMVKQIVSFARGRRGETGPVLMQVLVREMAKILESTFPKSITIHSRLPNDLWRVQGDPTELHQVLLNLSVNARDAMPEGGELTLAAENVELKPGDLPANPGAGAGPYLKISVTDTGVGIPAELLSRVFEPFFTTKAADKGTGLGLYTVSNIVKNHRGFLRIDSEVGKGTCFNLYLPAAQMAAKEVAPEPSRRPLPAGNGELIMVMDDEQAVRQLVRSSLESYGYRVLTVPNGLLGITCFEQNREQIKAIVSDTDMPFTDGLSALRTIQKSKPGIPIIIASGTKRSLESVDASHLTVLYKPYTVEELLLAVARSLRGD